MNRRTRPLIAEWNKNADYWESLARDSLPDVACTCLRYAKYLRTMAKRARKGRPEEFVQISHD
jgi:hypothetical protein